MKSKSFMRIVCMILSVILTLGLITGALVTVVSAAETLQLVSLLNEGKIKPLGRTQENLAGTGITANWSANGFEINVNANGGDFAVGYKTNQGSSYLSILVDGVQAWRGLVLGTGTVKTPITKGKHTVTVMRENGHSSSGYLHLTTVSFDGTVEAAPAKKDLYIEVVGDSYACGSGSAADYEAGVQWGDMDHSAQASFGWYLSKMLNADLSIVARGGIGLFDGTSEMEGTSNTITMYDIYPNASGHNTDEGAYSFARKPDLVIIELGANDGIDSADPAKTMEVWVLKLQRMINLVREKNGADTKILLLNHTSDKYYQMLKIADADDLIWSCYFSHHGNGSAALSYQVNGHPNADDEYEIAEALHKTIEDNDILGKPATAEPDYNDIIYYVSENGNDANDGKAIGSAKLTLPSALSAAKAGTYSAGDRVVVYVEGAVVGSTSQQFGNISAIKDTGGSRVPVLVATYNYNGSNAAELKHTFQPTAGGACATYTENDFYFRDLTIKSYTYNYVNDEGVTTPLCVNSFYSAGSNITFDNVTMVTDKQSSYSTWIVSADNFAGGAGILNARTQDIYSTITFKNGDYTGIYRVAALRANHIWQSSGDVLALPKLHCKIIIDEGAIMKDVYAVYGTMGMAEAVVELRGGTVKNYYPTRSGTASAQIAVNGSVKTVFAGGSIETERFMGTGSYVNIIGDVTTEFKKGQFVGTLFTGAGQNVNITGNITNNISGGEIRLNPTSATTGNDGIYLGGYKAVNLTGTLTNNISGGNLNLIYNKAVDCGIYLGMRSGSITGDLTNNISRGNFYVRNGEAKATSSGIYLGMYGGHVSGTQTNNITGGIFSGTVNFGFRTIGNKLSKMVNVIGVKGSLQGPRFLSDSTLGGGSAYLGTYLGNVAPTAENCSDTVVMHTTIYSGYFASSVYGSVSSKSYTNDKNVTTYSYTCGSILTDIYGGRFNGNFYATRGTTVAGHVTTNIYGGIFRQIYGNYNATVLDGVELNIYGMKEFYPLQEDKKVYGIWASGYKGNISATTEGRPAVALNIIPENNEDLVLRTPIYAGFSTTGGTVTGDTVVSVSGGFYPLGFKVDGKTVGEVLASGAALYHYDNGAKATYADTDASVSGYLQVVADGEAATRATAYYVRPNGLNTSDGKTFTTAKNTVVAAFNQAVTDNGGSTVFPNGTKLYIYVDGTVNDGSGQAFLYGKKLTTADGKPMETVVTTYNYSGTKATIVHDYTTATAGTNRSSANTALTLKNVDIMSKAPSGSNLQTLTLFAHGNTITFDNANLLTSNEKKWVVSADSFAGKEGDDAKEMNGTLIFKNGDYTNLDYVTTVNSGSYWYASGKVYESMPNMHTRIIVEDGAKMSAVYGPVGDMIVGSSTVEVRGGQVTNLHGTGHGDKTLTGDTNLLVSGGTVTNLTGTGNTSGSTVQLTGDVNITVSGGSVGTLYGVGKPSYKNTAAEQKNAAVTVIGDVNITVSGGSVGNICGANDASSAKSVNDSTVTMTAKVTVDGNMTNTFSGGTISSYKGTGNSVTLKGKLTTTVSGATVNAFSGTGDSANLQNGMSTTVSAGVVTNFYGTGAKAAVSGDMNNTFSGGTITGSTFYTLGNSSTLTGNMTNTFSGTNIEVRPTTGSNHGIFFAGNDTITIGGTVTNTVTAGNIGVVYDTNSMDSGIYFGNRNGGTIGGDLINNVSGGTFYTRKGAATAITHAAIHFAPFVGTVKGDLKSTVTGGTFEICKNNIYFGGRGIETPARSVTVVIGDEKTGQGPTFKGVSGAYLFLTGGWGRYGEASDTNTQPADGTVDTEVAVDLTIYGGDFQVPVIAGGNAAYDSKNNRKAYILGSVKTEIRGGSFTDFYASGKIPVYGNVTTDIYGGTFNSIYGGRDGKTFGEMALTIHGMTEGSDPGGIWAGGTSGTFTDVSLTIDPETKLTLSMPISAGCSGTGTISGTTSVLVTGGTYTKGFAVDGVTVKAALAEGIVPLKDGDKTLVTVTDTMTTTGTDSVTLVAQTLSADTASVTLSDASVTWDGKTNAKVPTATVKFHNSALADTEYTLSYSRSGQATTDLNSLGTVTVTATGKSPWTGSVSTTYTIVRDGAVGAAIADVTARVNDYDIDAVTQDDAADLTALDADIDQILADHAAVLTAEEKTSLNGLITQVQKLQTRIQEVATKLSQLTGAVASYEESTVTADDAANLTTLKNNLNAISNGNLTSNQLMQKQSAEASLAALEAKLAEVASDLAAAKTKAESYSEATVTADDAAALTQLAAEIAAIPDGNLTAAQKTEKKALADQVTNLQNTLSVVATELSRVTELADSFDPATVTADDSAELAALKTRIQSIPNANLTAAQKTQRDAALARVAECQAVIAQVAATLSQASDALADYTTANVTADASTELSKQASALAALSDANLTAAQKAEKTSCTTKISQLQTVISNVKVRLQDAEAEVARFEAMDVTADDLEDLEFLAAEIAAIPEGNLTAAQKATRQELLASVKALQDAIRSAADTLAALKAEIAAYSTATVTEADLDDLNALQARLNALPDNALSAAQKTEKQALTQDVAELIAVIAEVKTAIENAGTQLAEYSLDTVTFDDYDALDTIARDLSLIPEANMTQAQKQTVSDHLATISALMLKIDQVSNALGAVVNASFEFDTATVTADDLDELQALEEDLEAISNSNLNDSQLRQKQDTQARLAALKAQISEAARKLADAKQALSAFSEDTVTASDSDKLTQLDQDLHKISEGNLTAAQKAERRSAIDRVARLQKVISDVAAELTAVQNELAAYEASTVTMDDLAALQALQARLEAIAEGNLTAAQKTLKTQAESNVAAMKRAVENAVNALDAAKTEAAKYSLDTVTGDQMSALNDLAATVSGISDGNLTAAQKTQKQSIASQVSNLRDQVANVAAELARVKDLTEGYDISTVTAADSAALTELAADIAAIPEGNLTASQKAEKKTLADQVAKLQARIAEVADKLAAAKTGAGSYGVSTVTADDLPAINELSSDLAAIADGNLTAAQKSEKNTVSEKLEALKQAVQDAADALERAASLLQNYDVGSVTADESDILDLAEGRLLFVPDGNLTAAQKEEKTQLTQQLAAMRQAIADAENALAAVKEAADTYDVDTVNSSEAEALDTLEQQIAAVPDGNLTDAQKAEKKALQTKVDQLQKRLADTAQDLKELQEAVEAYDPENLTSADKAPLQTLAQKLESFPTDNLTASEKAALQDLAKAVADDLAIIEKAEEIAGNIDAIQATIQDVTAQNVTADDFADLQAAQQAIDQLEQNPDLKQADKDRLAALEDQIAKAQAQLQKADQANDLPADVLDTNAANVEPDDRDALEAAIKQLQDAQAAYGNNYTAAEKQAMNDAIANAQAALKVLDQVDAVEQQLLALPATASPDDEAAEKALSEAAAALESLDARQQAMISQTALDRKAALEKAMKDYKVTSGNNGAVSKESGKALTFVFNGNYKKFAGIQVDGTSVDAKFYTAKSGSTVITLKADYLDSLAEGKHILTVLYSDGSATAEFTVKPKEVTPPTGDDMNVGLMAVLAVISVMAAASVAIIGKKRRS